VAAGDYGIAVKDSKNCAFTSSIKIDAIPELKLSVINEKRPTCFDDSDGALTVGTSGGNGSYSYQWTNGPAAAQIENIRAGAYTVKVTDMKGCNLSSSFTHHLRGPVRLPGLITIFRLEKNPDVNFFFDKVEDQAKEIDSVVRQINTELDTETGILRISKHLRRLSWECVITTCPQAATGLN
jgi:hypothetical protein